jgi:hypothetical protein
VEIAAQSLILNVVRLEAGAACQITPSSDGGWVGELCLEDERFLATYTPHPHSAMTIYTDFGEMPAQDALSCAKRLLEVNLSLAASGRAGFGLDSETGHVVYALPVPVMQTAPDLLRQALVNIATQARTWRSNRFMANDDITPFKPLLGLMV